MTEPRESWAMLPRSLIRSGLDAECLRLYAHIDEASGPRGDWPVGGLQKIASDLGMQARTIAVHVEHLVAAKLIDVQKRSERAGEHLRITYQPARGVGSVDDVIIPPVHERHKPLSPYKRKATVSRTAQDIPDRPVLGAATAARQTHDMRDTRDQTCAERGSFETECHAPNAGLSKSAVSEESGEPRVAVVLAAFRGVVELCIVCEKPATQGTSYCREHEVF